MYNINFSKDIYAHIVQSAVICTTYNVNFSFKFPLGRSTDDEVRFPMKLASWQMVNLTTDDD